MSTKKFLFSAVFAALLGMVATPALAKGKLSVSPYLNSEYVLVSALNEEAADFSLVIRDDAGEKIYSSGNVEGSLHYNKVFDFSNLEDGSYDVVLRKSDKTVLTDEFSILGGKLHAAKKDSETEKMNAKVWSSEDYVFVSYLNDEADVYRMKITDETGDVLYESSLPESLTYSGKFDVSSLPSGNYVVSLTSGKKASRYGFTK